MLFWISSNYDYDKLKEALQASLYIFIILQGQRRVPYFPVAGFQSINSFFYYECIFLQAHQGLSDPDKKKLTKLIDFQKLSQEAGAHAAQNERLPLQSIVQVLYFEQLRLRNALCTSYADEDPKPLHQSWRISSGALSAAMSPRDNYASLRRENRELKLELARLRMRLNDLEKEHVHMKRDMQKSHSLNFMSSFSRKIGKLNFFGHSSSRGSSSPSKHSQRTDSKVIERT